jgi:uncharacterized membrane protein YciS (DUF1049 family)
MEWVFFFSGGGFAWIFSDGFLLGWIFDGHLYICSVIEEGRKTETMTLGGAG